jgi:Zn-dependent protease with chaperone function
MKMLRLIAPAIMILLPLYAYSEGRDMGKESIIEHQLEKISSESVEVFRQATAAIDRKDFDRASALYAIVLEKAPDFNPARRRLGVSLVYLGQPSKGMPLLFSAVASERSAANLMSLAGVLAYPPKGTPSPEDRKSAMTLAKEAFQKEGESDALFTYTDSAMRVEDENEFSAAVRLCRAKFPGIMETHYFSAIRAASNENWVEAEEEIKRAGELGLDPRIVEKFLESGIHRQASIWRYVFYGLYLLAAWAAGLVLMYVSGKVMSAKTMDAIKSADPVQIRDQLGGSFKRVYRALINIAGIYYYVSLPVLILLLLAVAGSFFYAFLLIGRIPIKLTILLVIVTVTTIYQMIRTLFIRQKLVDPGRELKREEAPGLHQLVTQVAENVGTRPIDQIRITEGTDLAVYEKGSYRARTQDKAQRMLILGIGVLDGFRLNAFRAVIAHEYGHFSNRDTAGGDAAFRVNADMSNFIIAILVRGLAVWYNCAFHFLRLYHFLFRRISHGASRLQEVMADIGAVTQYGAAAFEEGLRHAVLRGITFESAAGLIDRDQSLQTLSGLRALYQQEAQQPEEQKSIVAQLEKSITRPTSEDDTHPSPADRFALARRVQFSGHSEPDGMVWDLFADREGLTQEMIKLIGSRLGVEEKAAP